MCYIYSCIDTQVKDQCRVFAIISIMFDFLKRMVSCINCVTFLRRKGRKKEVKPRWDKI